MNITDKITYGTWFVYEAVDQVKTYSETIDRVYYKAVFECIDGTTIESSWEQDASKIKEFISSKLP